MAVFGWDASDFDWQRGPMDLDAAYRDGIRFFTHKATEGTKVIHRYYGAAMSRARAAGFEFVGAYIVPRTPGNNGHGSVQDQVSFFLDYLDSQTPWWRGYAGFFLQVDTEHWGYDDVSADIGAAVCAELGKRVDKLRIHYAPRWAYGDLIGGNDPLWASSYGANPAVPYRNGYPGDDSNAWARYSGRVPAILQYGSRLIIGSQSTCDGNAFRGSIEEFRAMITGGQDMLSPEQETELLRNVHNADWGVTQLLQGADPAAGFVQRGGTEFTVPNKLHSKLDDIKAAVSAQTAGMSDSQLADLEAKLTAKLPTAADIVTELLNRVPRA